MVKSIMFTKKYNYYDVENGSSCKEPFNISIYYTPIHYGISIISQLLLYLQLILVAVNITSHILPHFTIRI